MSVLLSLQQVVAGWHKPATQPVAFELNRGEVLGLTGPNGAGKSTLLALLAGRARCFSGQIVKAPGLTFSLQTQEVPPVQGLPLNGQELLALTGASPADLPPWLAGRLSQRLDCLSGGQRHYLLLWAVMHAPADVLLLDEPTNHLDRAGCAHLTTQIRTLAADGRGILIVSHDTDFVSTTCDRILSLEPCDVD